MRLVSWLAAVSLFPSCVFAQVSSYTFGPSPDNSIALEVEKTGLMRGKKHLFLFKQYAGLLQYETQRPEKSRVHFVIESGSLELLDTWPSEKDRQKIREYALKDMLAATRYPHIVFDSTKVESLGGGQFQVLGILTIRGIAKPAKVSVSMKEAEFDGEAAVKLTAYGLKPPTAALGAIGTKDQMRVSFRLRSRPQ